MALQLNEYAAKEVVAKHPDRFGFFAFLPMPGAGLLCCPACKLSTACLAVAPATNFCAKVLSAACRPAGLH